MFFTRHAFKEETTKRAKSMTLASRSWHFASGDMAYWSLSRASCAAETQPKVPEKKTSPHPTKLKQPNNKRTKKHELFKNNKFWLNHAETIPCHDSLLKNIPPKSFILQPHSAFLGQLALTPRPKPRHTGRVWCNTWCWVRNSLNSNKLESHVECSSSMIIIAVHRAVWNVLDQLNTLGLDVTAGDMNLRMQFLQHRMYSTQQFLFTACVEFPCVNENVAYAAQVHPGQRHSFRSENSKIRCSMAQTKVDCLHVVKVINNQDHVQILVGLFEIMCILYSICSIVNCKVPPNPKKCSVKALTTTYLYIIYT